MGYLIVFLGAGIGGVLRHCVNVMAMRMAFPGYAATCLINITGSFLIGAVAGYFALKHNLPPRMQLFLTTGVLGGATTFSAFSLETTLLIERHEHVIAAGYVAASVVLSIAGTFAALALVRMLFRPF